ncbi:MAG: diaminopimelate epimerase [Saprospiraceae bacterium]
MKLIPFEKYEGAGNDFILLDFIEGELLDLKDQVLMEKLCDRNFGIGADGIIALCPDEQYDFRMKYLNSDGRFSSFCGNGSRCISLYASRKWNMNKFNFIAADGPHSSEIMDHNTVKILMKDIEGLENTALGPLVQTGSPHLIVEVEDVFKYEINSEGKRLRNEFSEEGVNVNFIQITGDQSLKIATFERGVEKETLACGTGIVASSYYLANKLKLQGQQSLQVEAKGGKLQVELFMDNKLKATTVHLIGPANQVYSGFWPIY